jgi:predicted RNA-binding protein with PUA-like domain
MHPGDRVLFYHTGKEKAVVGEMVVSAEPKPDPKADDEAAVVVEVRPVRRFPVAVTLAQIKADKLLANWDLVRLPRLSVVPVTESQWKRIEELAGFPGKNRKSGGR